jgi:hypothetical protein
VQRQAAHAGGLLSVGRDQGSRRVARDVDLEVDLPIGAVMVPSQCPVGSAGDCADGDGEHGDTTRAMRDGSEQSTHGCLLVVSEVLPGDEPRPGVEQGSDTAALTSSIGHGRPWPLKYDSPCIIWNRLKPLPP